MSARSDRRPSTPLLEIFWTRTSLLLMTLIVISGSCLALSSVMDPGTGKNFVTSVGTGTLISAVVSFGQTLITSSATQKALVTPVIEESRRVLHELSAEYRSLNKEFFPTHVFEASNEPDPVFNQTLMQDLHATRQFFFRGFSGRHAAARLLASNSEWELRTVVADPRDDSGIGGRSRYLMRREGAEANPEEIRLRLHDEMRIGLVGLYLARSRCTQIDITAVTDPPLDRLEMFDDSAWITLYSDVGGASTLYPRTLRFSEGSFIYNMERAEFLRIAGSPLSRHFQLTPETSQQEFITLYTEITGSALSEVEFRELEGKFHAFRHEFSAAAELGS